MAVVGQTRLAYRDWRNSRIFCNSIWLHHECKNNRESNAQCQDRGGKALIARTVQSEVFAFFPNNRCCRGLISEIDVIFLKDTAISLTVKELCRSICRKCRFGPYVECIMSTIARYYLDLGFRHPKGIR